MRFLCRDHNHPVLCGEVPLLAAAMARARLVPMAVVSSSISSPMLPLLLLVVMERSTPMLLCMSGLIQLPEGSWY